MTRPINCTSTDPTILQLLYWISALSARDGHLVETDLYGNPVTISTANTKYPWPAPSVAGAEPESGSDTYSPPTTVAAIGSVPQFQLVPRDLGHRILLKPWEPENRYGQKSFRAVLSPGNSPVVVKLWDSYKSLEDARTAEVQIYMHLQRLWGIHIPMFICSADIDFCYGIVVEEIQVPLRICQRH